MEAKWLAWSEIGKEAWQASIVPKVPRAQVKTKLVPEGHPTLLLPSWSHQVYLLQVLHLFLCYLYIVIDPVLLFAFL